MVFRQNQSVYIPSLNPILWDSGFTSHIYYSIGKTARTLGVNPNAIRIRVKRATITFARVNDRVFIPTYSIRLQKNTYKKEVKELPVDDLSLLMIMDQGMDEAKATIVKEFLDLKNCFIVAFPTQSQRNVFAYKRINFEVAPNQYLSDCLVWARKDLEEEEYQEIKQRFFKDEDKALEEHFPPGSWHYNNMESMAL